MASVSSNRHIFAIAVLLVALGPRYATATDPSEQDPIVGKGFYFYGDPAYAAYLHVAYWAKIEDGLQFVRENPESEAADDVLLAVADKLAKKQKYTQAMKVLDTVLSEYPNSAFGSLASSYWSNQGSALQHSIRVRRYIREHPDMSPDVATLKKARLYELQGRRKEAVDLLQSYVKRFPKGRWTQEDVELRAAIKPSVLFRTHDYIFLDLAGLRYEQANFEEAIDVLNQALLAFSDSPISRWYYDLLAKSYQQIGEPAKEKQFLQLLQSPWAAGGSSNGCYHPSPRIRRLNEIETRLLELGQRKK